MLLAWLACSVELPLETDEDVPAVPVTVGDLWNGKVGFGGRATTVPVQVVSPRDRTGTWFFAQKPEGGPHSGLRVELGGVLNGWPPPVGTMVELTGIVVSGAGAPTLQLRDRDDQVVHVGIEPVLTAPIVAFDTYYALVEVPDLTITSAPDPGGEADTDGAPRLGGMFGAPAPGWGRTGTLVGIHVGVFVSPRGPDDWSGDFPGDPPVPVTAGAVFDGSLAEGTPVVLADVVQAVGWSRDGRATLLQDAAGDGVWVDAGGWGVDAHSAEGDVGTWVGEVRAESDDGPLLKVWDAPERTGSRTPVVSADLEDGALLTGVLTGLDGPDGYGAWKTDQGPVLEDLFAELVDLPDPIEVTGPVRVHEDGVRVFPVSWAPAP